MLFKKSVLVLLFCCTGGGLLHAQTMTITGKVTDKSGEPLVGVTITLSNYGL